MHCFIFSKLELHFEWMHMIVLSKSLCKMEYRIMNVAKSLSIYLSTVSTKSKWLSAQ